MELKNNTLHREIGKDEQILACRLISRVMCFNRYCKMAFMPILQSGGCVGEAGHPLPMSDALLRPGQEKHRSKLEQCEFVEFAQWEFILVSRYVNIYV